jgi:hypothetical protein
MLAGMSRLAQLQLIGPAALLAAAMGAEGIDYALALAPTSETLWYLAFNVFGAMHWSEDLLGAYLDVPHFQLCSVGLPLFVIGCCGLFLDRPLALAIASNLSFVYASLLIYAFCSHPPPSDQLTPVALANFSYLARIVFCGCTLLSFAISHIIYVRAIWHEYGRRPQSILQMHS